MTTLQTNIDISVNLNITPDELFSFYKRNDICEVGIGKDVAARILEHPHLIFAAYSETVLIGLARATFDGLSTHITEFSIFIGFTENEGHLVYYIDRQLYIDES